jgi:hypothetical protein
MLSADIAASVADLSERALSVSREGSFAAGGGFAQTMRTFEQPFVPLRRARKASLFPHDLASVSRVLADPQGFENLGATQCATLDRQRQPARTALARHRESSQTEHASLLSQLLTPLEEGQHQANATGPGRKAPRVPTLGAAMTRARLPDPA